MAKFEIQLPALGEGIIEAVITKWLVSEGDHVDVNQAVAEIATDKVDSEIPSPVEGSVVKLAYHEGETAKIGSVIALLKTESAIQDLLPDDVSDIAVRKPAEDRIKIPKPLRKPESQPQVSPLIRHIARQRGLTTEDINGISGTGLNETVTKEDIYDFLISKNGNGVEESPASLEEIKAAAPMPAVDEGDEVIEMSRIRKIIAEHMVRSKQVAPHVTSFAEADITGLVQWRENQKDSFYKREKIKLTYTPVFVQLVAAALKQFPIINSSVHQQSIILKKKINIGIATALPDGNLIVPVIRNADHENLEGLSHKIKDLAERARNNTLRPEEIKGGTFTITNIGSYTSLSGTPIINQPESAILAMGAIVKKPWAVKTSDGYGIAVRDIIMLSLTYDHRIIDGAMAGKFLGNLVQLLEQFGLEIK